MQLIGKIIVQAFSFSQDKLFRYEFGRGLDRIHGLLGHCRWQTIICFCQKPNPDFFIIQPYPSHSLHKMIYSGTEIHYKMVAIMSRNFLLADKVVLETAFCCQNKILYGTIVIMLHVYLPSIWTNVRPITCILSSSIHKQQDYNRYSYFKFY
jgi:hypothetical protein